MNLVDIDDHFDSHTHSVHRLFTAGRLFLPFMDNHSFLLRRTDRSR